MASRSPDSWIVRPGVSCARDSITGRNCSRGRKELEAKIVDLDAIFLGEFQENAMRKDFTVSERVAIGKAIEEYLGNRQGQRTDKELVANFPQVKPGRKTREIAAEKAGFGNDATYRQAKKVVERAEPESSRRSKRSVSQCLKPPRW
jgi:phosphopentomutase